MAVNKCTTNFSKTAKNTKQLYYTYLTNLCIKLQNVISMITFRGTSSPDEPPNQGLYPWTPLSASPSDSDYSDC